MNHIFDATAPTIKPFIKELHNVSTNAFLVDLISLIPIYWFCIFYWYQAWQNLMSQNDITSKIQLQLCNELVNTVKLKNLCCLTSDKVSATFYMQNWKWCPVTSHWQEKTIFQTTPVFFSWSFLIQNKWQ